MGADVFEPEEEKSLLLSLSHDITSCRTKEDVQDIVTNKLAQYFQHNDLIICLKDPDNLTYDSYLQCLSLETKKQLDLSVGEQLKSSISDGIFDILQRSTGPVVFDLGDLLRRAGKPSDVDFWHRLSVKEIVGFVLRVGNESIGSATLYARSKNRFNPEQLSLAQALFSYIGIALWNIRNSERINIQLEEITRYKSQLELEYLYLKEQVKTATSLDNVIGAENGLRQVFSLVSNVASSDTTVLLQGETGTGKELIAHAIHNNSPRKDRLMVKINCAALPPQLIESELFGHEKGSFTGAMERRIGKFELANNSSLFLDEVGEMPLELQAKLLRAIQEKEIERVGGRGVVKTNVRIITATNRDLQKEVASGRFRHDLFYRLNVFPITVPALRDRKADIPALVSGFIQRFSTKSGRGVLHISPAAIKQLSLYDWPGNVRELEHVIERSILMAQGNTIKEVYLPVMVDDTAYGGSDHVKSLAENEREYILSVLKKCDGTVRRAAELLGVPPTTLHSKMKKLGIQKVVS